MAQRAFVHLDDLPQSIQKFLKDSGFVGLQLTTEGPCVIKCDAVSNSAFEKLVDSFLEYQAQRCQPEKLQNAREKACKFLRLNT